MWRHARQQRRLILMTLRSFRSATPLPKRVSKLKLTELKVETIAAKPLEHIIPPTGSVVLDTVREFTRKYPQCVLLVQVGDFYEVQYTRRFS